MSTDNELDRASILTSTDICSIPVSVNRDEAASIILTHSGDFSVQVQKLVYYPYLWVLFEYSVKTLLGRSRKIKASCLVDLINNQAATTDKFSIENITTNPDSVLEADFSEEAAFETARTYLTHAAIHKMKALLAPDYQVIEKKTIYKPFWIVRCKNREKTSFKAIVDSVTGKYQVL